MITHEMYQAMLGDNVLGEARKKGSDMLMDATFKGDIQYQTGYFFDYYHTTTENRLKLEGFNPEEDPNATPVELKFIAHTSKTYEKDAVTMHIQFRPGYKCTVDYYEEMFGKRYGAEFPVGLYVWLFDRNTGVYRRWLVVATADTYEHLFPTWEVLRCDNVFRWVKNGKLYEFPGVSRSQNSYNSGLWLDYRFQQPEDQTKFALPLNRDTEYLYYNTRLIIDAPVLTEPRAWLISKINRDVSRGVVMYTTAQDLFNQHTDQAFYDDDGNVKYWVADWNISAVTPVDAIPQSEDSITNTVTSKITYSGITNHVRVGGSKTFTISYYDNNEQVDYTPGTWSFKIDGNDVVDELTIIPVDGDESKVKIKVKKDDALIGKILNVINNSNGIISQLDCELIAL